VKKTAGAAPTRAQSARGEAQSLRDRRERRRALVEENERLAELDGFGLETGEIELTRQELAEEDWADNWKKYFEPARITHDLTIVPSWTEYEATAGEKIIKLDPGMAFGTGTHPTTKMSLFALEQVLRGGETVLDVGTGSGVLSIASSILGAKDIYAYDLDEVAVRVAQENIELNPGMENIHVAPGDLLRGVEIEADVIVANILADILVHLTNFVGEPTTALLKKKFMLDGHDLGFSGKEG